MVLNHFWSGPTKRARSLVISPLSTVLTITSSRVAANFKSGAFSSSFAMGCSQAWPAGLTPNEFFPFLDIIKNRMNILNLGVYELSPPLDLDDRTSKLVAQIIYRYLHT